MKQIACLLTALCLPLAAFAQGALTPPGAPAPLFKTLDQLEPRTPISSLPISISSSGSYYLTASLTATTAVNGITIATSDVTLDLNGFTLRGNSNALTGVFVNGGISDVVIRNGTIRNWKLRGIDGQGNLDMRVENLHVLFNGSIGIETGGNSSITGCLARGNGGSGIVGAGGSRIQNCQAIGNTNNGIVVTTGSTVTDCTASANSTNGVVITAQCNVSGCTIIANQSIGLFLTSGIGRNRIVDNFFNSNALVDLYTVPSDGHNLIIRNVLGGASISFTELIGNVETVDAQMNTNKNPHANFAP